jgi:hypothetical protein
MPYKDKDKQKNHKREYYEKNKDKILEERKEYRINNKEKIKEYCEANKEEKKEYDKEYRLNNKDKIKEERKEYRQTEAGKKSSRISTWKKIGVESEDYDALYEYYLNCKYCENCEVELVEGSIGANKKCLDHDHKTGLFRNVLCNTCNVRRG